MNKSPAFQFYPDKWESHTNHLSDYAYRVYHRLICWMWQHSEDRYSIKADPMAIATVLAEPCGRIADAMQELCNEYMPLLKTEGDRWVCEGLRKEVIKQNQHREKAQAAANARWSKSKKSNTNAMQTHSASNADASNKQCSLSSSSSSNNNINIIKGMLSEFGRICKSLPQPKGNPSKPRQSALLARFKDLNSDIQNWSDLCETVEESDFLTGRTDNPFTASIDWITKPANFTKIIEGNYKNKKQGIKPSPIVKKALQAPEGWFEALSPKFPQMKNDWHSLSVATQKEIIELMNQH